MSDTPRPHTAASMVLAVLLCAGVSVAASADDGDYVTGGPLAGVRLPPFPTQHGEPPGFPGSIRQPNGDFAYTNNVKFRARTPPATGGLSRLGGELPLLLDALPASAQLL
jgi:hypothetical protein